MRLRWKASAFRSRPGRALWRYCELLRADGVVLLSLFDTVLIRCRE
jgi:hypothetical protein